MKKPRLTMLFTALLLVAFASPDLVAAQTMPMTMNEQMDKLRGLNGRDFDVQFMKDMIGHHQSAIEMASLAPANANRQEVKDLAASIVADQQREIGEMTGWLRNWYNEQPAGMMMMTDMQAKVDRLKTLRGDEFDRQFLIDMIPHHQDAVDMAKLIPERAARAELKTLGQNITSSQSREIDQMTGWLNQWYNVNTQGQPLVSSAAGTTNVAPTSPTTTLPPTGNANLILPFALLLALLALVTGLVLRRRTA